MKKRKYMNLIKLLSLVALTFLVSSCMKNTGDDYSAEYKRQFEEMKATRSDWNDTIGYGVCIAIDKASDDTLSPTSKNAVLISYNCYNGLNEMIATSDSATAQKKDLYRSDVIYGPTWVEIQYAIPGFYLAVQQMNLGDSATIIIPSDMAGFGGPLKYQLKLNKVISDFTKFEIQQRTDFMTNNNFNDNTVSTAIDSTLWYKLVGSPIYNDEVSFDKQVSIELTANYCEVLPGLVNTTGRQFLPINNKGKELDYYFENIYSFPITPAIDSVVRIMCDNHYREADFITSSVNAYGSSGFIHPSAGSYIIPPYMSIHYTIKLKAIK
jgi:hypothetical protein